MDIADSKRRYHDMVARAAKLREEGRDQEAGDLEVEIDYLGEAIWHQEHGEVWDPELGAYRKARQHVSIDNI